jgi:hypothetical protein
MRSMTMPVILHRNGRIQDPEQLWDSCLHNNTKTDSIQELVLLHGVLAARLARPDQISPLRCFAIRFLTKKPQLP